MKATNEGRANTRRLTASLATGSGRLAGSRVTCLRPRSGGEGAGRCGRYGGAQSAAWAGASAGAGSISTTWFHPCRSSRSPSWMPMSES